MSNLLPPGAQKRVNRMYRARVVTTLSIAVIALTGIFLLALIPTYLTLAASAPRENPAQLKRNAETTQAVMRAQTIIDELLPVLASTSTPSTYLEAALAVIPNGVSVMRVTFGKKDDGAGTMMLVGEASRDKVAAFRDTLSAHPLFKSATVPVSALVGTGAGQYSLTLELAGAPTE